MIAAQAEMPLANVLAALAEFPAADESQALVVAKCRALITGYHRRWAVAGYVPESVEQTLLSDLYNPDTEGKSRSFQVAGKLDVVATYLGRRVLVDHKTTSQDIADPNAPYWRQLVVEGQVSHYMLLQWMHAQKCDDALWDCCRKPSISPKKITKAERASVVAEGRYFNARISNEDRQVLAQGEERETLAMYEARLVHDCTEERPEWYFARRGVPRMDSEILEYARELWQHSQDMLYTRSQKQLPPRNSGACLLYGTPCAFLGVCSGHDSIDSERWKKKENIHPELPLLDNQKELLTNSRIRCWQTCRRMEYYKYVLGVERVDAEEKEALYFGTVWHTALESWWNSLMPQETSNGDEHSVDAGQVCLS